VIKLKFTTLVAAAAFMVLGGATVAQQTPMQQDQMQRQSRMSALSASEQQFLTKNATDSIYEFISAQLAVQKAKSPQLEQYALRIMDDHAQFNKALMQLARQKGLTLPVDLSTQDRGKLAHLMRLSGAEFDREYTQEVAKANAASVSEDKRAASTAKDQDVQAFIAKFSPVDQEHLQLANALKGSSTSGSSAQ